MEKLKPCPFCGGKVRVYYTSELKSHFVVHAEDKLGCWVLMPLIIRGAKSLAEAEEAWNRRPKNVEKI